MDFPFELDHVVVFVSLDAPEAKTLEAIGLQGFGGVTRHGNLGTASTSFFFSNSLYLELFWVPDLAAAKPVFDSLSLDMDSRMRWRETGASPFGLMLRRRQAGANDPPPFPVKRLAADWMPAGTAVEFNGEAAAEPYYGVVPENLSFRGFRADIPDLPHLLGVKRLTGVNIAVQNNDLSPIARSLSQNGVARIEPGIEPLLTLTFDDGAQGKTVDVRPALPLVLK
jgi:hypothetical protein